jgi:hypothetical protein
VAAPSRRRLLQLGLVGGALLAVGGLSLAPSRVDGAPPGLRLLNPREWAVLDAVAARICPGPPSARELGVAALVDQALVGFHPADVTEIKQALMLLENGLFGLLSAGRPVPFTRASPEQQDATLQAWRESPVLLLRSAYKALRNLCASTWHAQPGAWAAVGYPGPPDFGQAAAPALQPPQPPPAPPAPDGAPPPEVSP